MALLIFVAVSLVQPASGESLGAAAKREKERRARNKEAGVTARVVDPNEIGTYQDPAAEETGSETSPKASSSFVGSPSDARPAPSAKQTDESLWRARKAQVRDSIARAQKEYDEAMAMPLKQAGPDRYREHDGMISWGPDPSFAQENEKIFARRRQAQANLERARQAEPQLEEDARRAGALPGWLR
jgi:hypothetical protein